MQACGRSKRSQARDYLAHSFARAWPESVQHEKSNRSKNRSRGHQTTEEETAQENKSR